MLTSLAHVRPSGGLMVKNSNISKDQLLFLKGNIEAIVATVDRSHYLNLFDILMILIAAKVVCSKFTIIIINFVMVFACV